MGYIYEGKRLVCDICDKAGARKRRCTYNYCPATAACDDCFKRERATMKKWHEDHCREASANLHKREAHEAELLAAGKYLLAAGYGPGRFVHASFRNAEGDERCVFIPREIYARRGKRAPTLDELEALNGKAFPMAPMKFIDDPAEIDRRASNEV